MTSPWHFDMWGFDIIGPINPKANNEHRFIEKDLVCRYGLPARLIIDNA
jgi:hypothetical protein